MRKPKVEHKNPQNQLLFQELNNLEEKWDTFKPIRPQPHFRRCSTGGLYDFLSSSLENSLLKNSPRSLMSSLQENRRKSAILMEDGYWKVRTNDLAAQEILWERRAALVSGKLKGRRLFGGLDNGDHEICSHCFDMLQESHEVRSVGSYGSDDYKKFENSGERNRGILGVDNDNNSCLSDEKMVENLSLMGAKKGVVEVKEKPRVVVGSKLGGSSGGRWMLAMAWFGIVTMLLTLGLISMSCNGGNLHEEKVILIPT